MREKMTYYLIVNNIKSIVEIFRINKKYNF